jgi:hypothetical protein
VSQGGDVSEVTSVNGKTGAVVLTASNVEAVPTSEVGQPSGVASLNGSGVLPESELPSSVVSGSAAGATALQPATAEADYVSRATTALNLVTDFGAATAEPVTASMNSTTTITVTGAKSTWVGQVICGEGITRGTTVVKVSGTSVEISKAATLTSAETKVNIGPDCSAACEAFWKKVEESARPPLYLPNVDDSKVFQYELYIPAGRYIVTKPKAMMNASGTAIKGLKITGAGKDATTILFAPAEENGALLKNKEAVFRLTFEHMTFACVDSTATWLESIGPIAQDYTCNSVNWTGEWKYGYKLTGTNNNSEFRHDACSVYGSWTAFLYSPAETEGSDQFLDYWFTNCVLILNKGNFIDMAAGGSIECCGGSYILNGNGSEEQVLFRLRGETHASNTMSIGVIGVRAELRHAQAKWIDTEWSGTAGNSAQISFKDCHDDAVNAEHLPTSTTTTTTLTEAIAVGKTLIPVANSEAGEKFKVGQQVQLSPGNTEKQEVVTVTAVPNSTHIETTATTVEHPSGATVQVAIRPNAVRARFRGGKACQVTWENCSLAGAHQYDIMTSAFEYRRSHEYQNCTIADWQTAQLFVYNWPNGSALVGNRQPVTFDDMCQGSKASNYKYMFGCTINWDRVPNGKPRLHYLSIRATSSGGLIDGSETEEAIIPGHALITKIRSWKGETGALAAANWAYKLLDESNSGAVIATIAPGEGGIPAGREWKKGWSYELLTQLRGKALPAEGWKLKLEVENVTEQQEESFIIVEYLA